MADDALILDSLRTPIGRYRGALSGVRPDDLAALVIARIVERSGIDPARIDELGIERERRRRYGVATIIENVATA